MSFLTVEFGHIGSKYHVNFDSLSLPVYHSLVREVLSPVVATQRKPSQTVSILYITSGPKHPLGVFSLKHIAIGRQGPTSLTKACAKFVRAFQVSVVLFH